MELDRVRRHARLTVVVVEEGDSDHSSLRADPCHFARVFICLRRYKVAPAVQSGEGVSAIIVREPLRRTRWWSRSASLRSSVTAAMTL